MTHDSRGRLAVDLGGAWRLYWGNSPLPAGAQALGTVTRGIGDTGALLRTGAGIYMQGNAGALRSLDQRKIAAATVPQTDTERQRARYARAALVLGNITLDAEHATKLAAILKRTHETRADFVRRMIREQA